MADPANSRDSQGRFVRGGPGGPGRPKGSGAAELRQALKGAITPDHMEALMRKALILALNGNLAAMKFITDRVCGKAAEERVEAEPVGITLPRLRTAGDCNRALDVVLEAFCEGTLDEASTNTLVAMVQARVKAIEAHEHEQRIAELEKAARVAKPAQPPMPRRAW